MKPVGIAVAFAGYTLAYFGWASTRGPGTGLLDLLVPGRVVIIASPTAAQASSAFIGALNPAQRRRYARTQGAGGAQQVPDLTGDSGSKPNPKGWLAWLLGK